MRKILMVAALVLALGCPAFAGIMHTPAPQPATSTIEEPKAEGEIHTPLTVDETTARIVLNLLLDVLPLI